MHTIELVTTDGKSIYRGDHNSLNEAIQTAIQKNIPLDGINLAYTTLHHINLDGVIFRNACFKGADLYGANMSEAEFFNCDFSTANLKDACLCYSNINQCNFRLCKFNETDIAMCSIKNCDFEGFSTFQLRLHSAHEICELNYNHYEKTHQFSEAPTLIQSGNKMAALIGNIMICNGIPHTFEYGTIANAVAKFQSYKNAIYG